MAERLASLEKELNEHQEDLSAKKEQNETLRIKLSASSGVALVDSSGTVRKCDYII